MAFTTLANVKAVLRIPTADTSQDTLLTLIVNAANQTVLDIFGLTDTAVTSYTDRIDVDDDTTHILFTRKWPLVAVTSVTERTVLLAATSYSGNELGAVKRLPDYCWWGYGREAIVIVYTAGWTTVPGDLIWAATLIAVHSFNTGSRAGLNSEKIGQYSYELGGASVAGGEDGGGGFGIPPEAERILANYRRAFTLPN